MTEYSYSDLVKMQDQAIRRVREMQERARLTVRENPIPELETAVTEKDESESGTRTEAEKTVNAPKPQVPKEKKPPQPHDKDRSILLPLIMLLSREGADNILMIALLYILA